MLLTGKVCFANTLSPEQFLETYSNSNKTTRQYFGNLFLTMGVPVMGSSLLMEDNDNKTYAVTLGGVYSGLGLLIKMIPSEVEMKMNEYRDKPDKSALERVKELKNSQKKWRYISSAALAIPLLFDFSGEKTTSNPHPEDANVAIKTLLASASIGMLIFQTPLENLCEEVIKGQDNNFSINFSPGIDQTKLYLAYKF